MIRLQFRNLDILIYEIQFKCHAMKGQSIVRVAKINLYNFPWNELREVWNGAVE